MSLFSWFRRKPAPSKAAAAPQHAAGLLQADATVPLGTATRAAPPVARPAETAGAPRNERMERRELLYSVVRDAMVRASVLTAGYKFKVLSLDQRGRQFLVMIDLAREYGGDTNRLSEMEALIAQTAKGRHDILVTAVYWRIHEHVAVGVPQKPAAADASTAVRPATGFVRPQRPDRTGPASAPAPLSAGVTAPTASVRAPAATAVRATPPATAPATAAAVPASGSAAPQAPRAAVAPARAASPYEPIEADEVAAFKRALAGTGAAAAGGGAVSSAAAAQPGVTVRSGPLLPLPEATGFEDTEMPESRGPDLSSTQYGELR